MISPRAAARRLLRPIRGHRRQALGIACLLGLPALAVAGANAYVILGSEGESTGVPADAPRAQVAIVPGAFVQPDGR